MKRFFLFAMVFLVLTPLSVRATELDDAQLLRELGIDASETDAGQIYQFPEIDPEITLYLGSRQAEVQGSRRVYEYDYLEDSIPFGGAFRVFAYPHRMYLVLDALNSKEHFGELRYAYGDRLLSQWIHHSFFHNFPAIDLIDLDPLTTNPGVDDSRGEDGPGVQTDSDRFLLRWTKQNFPLHVSLDALTVYQEGTRTQRSLLGSGYFNNMIRAVRGRDVTGRTTTIVTGADAHLGPIEVALEHREKRFDVHNDSVLFDAYGGSPFRPAGVYPHNLIPELKGSSNRLKVHTSYTGKWVAAASIGAGERKNESSRSTADQLLGAGSLRWAPFTDLSLYVRYAHKDIDADNPGRASITDRSDPANTFTYSVKPPVSSTSGTVTVGAKYRVRAGTVLRAKYSYKEIERDNASLWNLEKNTIRNTATLSADTHIGGTVSIQTRYTYRDVDHPSYNTEPRWSHAGEVLVSALPHPKLNALLSYHVSRQERDKLVFEETAEARNRDVKLNNIVGTGIFQLRKDLSLTATLGYFRHTLEQDIVYDSLAGVPLSDAEVPLEDRAWVFSTGLQYCPRENLRFQGELSQTRSKSKWSPHSSDLLSPISIASFSQQKLKETDLHFSGEYRWTKNLFFRLDYRYGDFEDVLRNIHDSDKDGDAHLVQVTLSRRWR